jgi:hypothetical protein
MIIAKSYLLEVPREWLLSNFPIVHKSVTCCQCNSFWIGMIIAYSLHQEHWFLLGLAASGVSLFLNSFKDWLENTYAK